MNIFAAIASSSAGIVERGLESRRLHKPRSNCDDCLPFNDAPLSLGPWARALNGGLRLLSKPFRSVAKSWMEWSRYEYELFRARSGDEGMRT